MIEEFMLMANMSVARRISKAFPEGAMLRRHPQPRPTSMDVLVCNTLLCLHASFLYIGWKVCCDGFWAGCQQCSIHPGQNYDLGTCMCSHMQLMALRNLSTSPRVLMAAPNSQNGRGWLLSSLVSKLWRYVWVCDKHFYGMCLTPSAHKY